MTKVKVKSHFRSSQSDIKRVMWVFLLNTNTQTQTDRMIASSGGDLAKMHKQNIPLKQLVRKHRATKLADQDFRETVIK